MKNRNLLKVLGGIIIALGLAVGYFWGQDNSNYALAMIFIVALCLGGWLLYVGIFGSHSSIRTRKGKEAPVTPADKVKHNCICFSAVRVGNQIKRVDIGTMYLEPAELDKMGCSPSKGPGGTIKYFIKKNLDSGAWEPDNLVDSGYVAPEELANVQELTGLEEGLEPPPDFMKLIGPGVLILGIFIVGFIIMASGGS